VEVVAVAVGVLAVAFVSATVELLLSLPLLAIRTITTTTPASRAPTAIHRPMPPRRPPGRRLGVVDSALAMTAVLPAAGGFAAALPAGFAGADPARFAGAFLAPVDFVVFFAAGFFPPLDLADDAFEPPRGFFGAAIATHYSDVVPAGCRLTPRIAGNSTSARRPHLSRRLA
jgi:hypothetical protein